MDIYTTVFEVIDTRSFTSIWYWILLALLWSRLSHRVLGVPVDLVSRAHRGRAGATGDLEALVEVNITRMLATGATAAAALVAVAAFVFTGLALLGFWYGVEFAQAAFLLLFPLVVVAALSIRAARRIAREGQGGEVLCARLFTLRFQVQLTGLVAIFVTAFWGMYQSLAFGLALG